jgi:hypothetical protein
MRLYVENRPAILHPMPETIQPVYLSPCTEVKRDVIIHSFSPLAMCRRSSRFSTWLMFFISSVNS